MAEGKRPAARMKQVEDGLKVIGMRRLYESG
jgi:hypothetical protein